MYSMDTLRDISDASQLPYLIPLESFVNIGIQ